jgi:hypothetical protein
VGRNHFPASVFLGDENEGKAAVIEFDESSYRKKTDSELERLLGQFDDLVDNAQLCLISELKARGRTEKDLSSVLERSRKRKIPLSDIEGLHLALAAQVGSVRRVYRFRGSLLLATGRAFYGAANRAYNEEYAYSEFDTTLWWMVLGIPVIPRGSFRIRSRAALPYILGDNFVVVRRLPFMWAQNAARLALDAVLLLLLLLWAVQGALQQAI